MLKLIVNNNYHASLGETIFYINNGTKKSSGDVQKMTKPTKKQQEEYVAKHGKEMPANYIDINCYMINEKDMIDNPLIRRLYEGMANLREQTPRVQ